jgi:hypothetical protein
MNWHESSRIKQNSYELRWINYDLYEFIWYNTERRVATGGSLALTAWVCELIQNITWINMNYLELIRMNMSQDELVTIYTNLYDIMRSDVLQRGAVLLLQCVCVWINTKYKKS